uniref:FSD1-like protein n=1 Tax=Phallusia mammillata TaxID=59560 RepID=A0A6F9DDP2_9ASCI|nr:FSD1-like protein [Phallusia mammillata]
MEKQKEALLRIVDQLKNKNDEASSCHADLLLDVRTLNEAYESSQADLNAEFEKLFDALTRKKEKMKEEIQKNLENKSEIIKTQLKLYEESRSDADELILLSNKALGIDKPAEFSKTALAIKERITMSSIFRLSITASVIDPTCHLVADFTREERILNNLAFLPVPGTPIIDETLCETIDNSVTCQWQMPIENDIDDTDVPMHSTIESFLFQYRQVNNDQGNQDVPWKTVENLKHMKYTIEGLIFTKPLLQVRVQAWNKSVGGNFSSICIIQTPAFNFELDKEACHGSLKISSPLLVEWDPASMKGAEARVKSGGINRPSSPIKTASPKKAKSKDRFTGESYTVLGNSVIESDDNIYFETTPQEDTKTYSIGISSRALSRYDQLGRTPHSWCITANTWIQKTFVAKHNNKIKNLDQSEIPKKFGIFFSPKQSYLAFYDPSSHRCIYSFKQVKSSTPLVPGFSVWCGSIQVYTGIQVPSWVETKPNLSPKTRSMSIVSSEVSQND